MPRPPQPDPRVTKRKVTMRSAFIDASGVHVHEVADYVRPDVLDAYMADARLRWQTVDVSDEPDAGPAGYSGATAVHAGLDHELAGTFYPASDCVDCDHAPAGYRVIREG